MSVQTELESTLMESLTQIGSSTQGNETGSSTQRDVIGPSAQPLQTITPFNEIIKAQLQEEAQRKAQLEAQRKGKAIEASTSRITRSPSFDTYSKFKFFRTLVKTTGNMELSDPNVKYASHFAFNKVVAYPRTSPALIRILYQYGMLHAIYLSNDLKEIKELPEPLQEAVGIFAGVVTQYSMYIRFYSTIAEITPDKFYPPISLIKFGTTRKPIETEAEIKEEIEEEQEFQNKMSNIRAQNYHIIFQEMNRTLISEKQWVYYCGKTTIIASFGKKSHDQPLFIQWYDRLRNNKMENSEKTMQKICNLLAEYSNHRCKYCEEREKAMHDIEDPETDLSVL